MLSLFLVPSSVVKESVGGKKMLNMIYSSYYIGVVQLLFRCCRDTPQALSNCIYLQCVGMCLCL